MKTRSGLQCHIPETPMQRAMAALFLSNAWPRDGQTAAQYHYEFDHAGWAYNVSKKGADGNSFHEWAHDLLSVGTACNCWIDISTDCGNGEGSGDYTVVMVDLDAWHEHFIERGVLQRDDA